ncbi:MAG TPA: 3-hydroxyacyl-CoA dehydrogenase NAD-binding domain-containing protein [Gammaproteobacteria bacterium]|jgi:3-hydroxyacyl-CoA dehydrogenase/enoyl-CoA hydratase/3-hydroxybutyryl-CoA epimerase|nr:3-hydroxyacyl-CoA dehydrogenase NAD-binding domain-containing protein [Gammaproteobacteria bacterium]
MSDISSQSNWRIEQDTDGVAWLCFDKAGASTNVLSGQIMQELGQRLADLEKLKPRGVVIYSGKKSGFIAGADIKEFTTLKTPDEAFKLIRGGQLVLEQLEKLPCPSAVIIQGFCLGGGLELSLACRYRVGVDDEKLNLGLPEVKLGIHPGFGGTVRAPRLVGVLPAMSFMLNGRSVHGREAAKIGLLDRLVKETDARTVAKQLVLKGAPRRQAPLLQKLLSFAPLRPLIAGQLVKQVASKVRRDHYPAPYAIIDLWKRYAGSDQMYVQEAHSIAALMLNDTSHSLVRVFLLTDRLKSLGKKSDLDLKHVHVVGAGTMGGDIAAWCALRGFDVTLQDREEKYIQPAMARAQKLFEKKLKGAEIQKATARLKMDVAGAGAKDAQVAIEAIFEDVTAKQDLYKKLDAVMGPGEVLATNTSSIRLETLRTVLKDPKRLVGLHFFNPVAKMPLVEVIHSDDTPKEVVAKALAFTRHIDKLAVPVKSAPGFLVNRILMPYLMEAMLAADEGVALEAIDQAALNYGMPMGPAELADTVGLDVCMSVSKVFAKEFNKKIPESLGKLVEAKKLGRKTGEGFYKYVDGKPVKDRAKAGGATQDLQDRLILPMLNEAVAVLREAIVADADLLDAGVIFGTGFAPFRGGPINYIRAAGADGLQARLQELAKVHGERFKPDAGWSAAALREPKA